MSVEEEKINNADEQARNEAQSDSESVSDEAVEEQGESAAKEETAPTGDAALMKKLEEHKENALRAQAELQNVRRRAEKDVEKAHKFALEKFAKELLPVIDSLEKTIEAEKATGNESGPLREGVEMTLSMFISCINKFNLEQIDPVGQPFDPELHEAMSMVESPDAEPNTVIAAMQKGYTLSGRLVRPAMVVVAKNSGNNPTNVDEKA